MAPSRPPPSPPCDQKTLRHIALLKARKGKWVKVADESAWVPAPPAGTLMRFGAGAQWVEFLSTGPGLHRNGRVYASAAVLGDPAGGVFKTLEVYQLL